MASAGPVVEAVCACCGLTIRLTNGQLWRLRTGHQRQVFCSKACAKLYQWRPWKAAKGRG